MCSPRRDALAPDPERFLLRLERPADIDDAAALSIDEEPAVAVATVGHRRAVVPGCGARRRWRALPAASSSVDPRRRAPGREREGPSGCLALGESGRPALGSRRSAGWPVAGRSFASVAVVEPAGALSVEHLHSPNWRAVDCGPCLYLPARADPRTPRGRGTRGERARSPWAQGRAHARRGARTWTAA